MSDGVTRRKRKGRDVFLAQVRVGDVYRSKTFADYQQAVDWHDQKKAEIKGDREAIEPPKATKATSLFAACEWGIAKLETRKKTPAEIPNDKNVLAKLRWWMAQEEVADISLAALNRFHVEEVIAGAQVEGDGGAQTQIHRVNAISWLYQEWWKEFRVEPRQLPNPAEGARPPQPDGRTRRCKDRLAAGENDRDEEAELLEEARKSSRKWLAPAIVIAIDTCMRQGELVGLRWRDIVLDGSSPHATLAATITKSKKPRTIRLSRRAIEAFRELQSLEDRMPDRPLPLETTRGVLHAWTALIADARRRAVEERALTEVEAEATVFPDLYWHDLRHEGISRLFERTALTDLEIKEIAGHSSLQTTAIYTHLRGANIDIEAKPRGGASTATQTDEPGTVKLTEDGPLVLTVQGKWLPLREAKGLTRAHAEALIRGAAAAL